jgi:glycosyltransferase involved in cell wall biosynthesis
LRELGVNGVEFVDFVPYEQLPARINAADVCLGGHFSKKDKAARVIAGKTFQFLACGRPTIVGDNPANRELFREGGLVHFVPMGDCMALADKIMELTKAWEIAGE